MEDNLQWKTTSNGRQSPTEGKLQRKTTSNGRQPAMEDKLQWKTTTDGRWRQILTFKSLNEEVSKYSLKP
jgi:hypothetical protein